MSRCFPFRPPLCARDGASGEALIETIKINCEKVKSKPESLKEKKRGRKEKRKERKEKEIEHLGSVRKLQKLHNEKCYQEEKSRSFFVDQLSKTSEDEEPERLEKSSVTEEHDEPVGSFSDETQSSNKRKRESSPPSTPSVTVCRNILRIRLPSLKCRETYASPSEGQSCFTAGRVVDSPVQQAPVKEQFQITSKVDDKSNTISDSCRKGSIAPCDSSITRSGATSHDKKASGRELLYKSLTEDWVPPPFQAEPSEGSDEDWLFGKRSRSQEIGRLEPCKAVPCCRSSSLWPSACFLQEANVYALPYSMPF